MASFSASGSGTLPPALAAAHRRWRLGVVLGMAVLGIVGVFTVATVERAMRENLASGLTTILDADTTAVRMWLETQRNSAQAWTKLPELERDVELLAAAAPSASRDDLLRSEAAARIRSTLAALGGSSGHLGFSLLAPSGRVIGAESDERIGTVAPADLTARLEPAFAGRAVVTVPFEHRGRPLMVAAAPVTNADGEPIAVLALRLDPQDEFTRILSVARFGKSGDTYAFDAEGRMLSETRFTPDLAAAGVLEPGEDARSSLRVEIRNPGVNLLEGDVPAAPLRARPLTRMAADAVLGLPGVDVGGYRDYRGVPVVGAWTWLEGYEIGIATEVDRYEAYRPVRLLRIAFSVLFGMLVVATGSGLLASRVVLSLRRRLDGTERVGQYQLIRKVGEGGMGEVYLASHEMMRRPTAIKLMRPERASEEDISRFEREVRLTARLTHPSTVAIYDFGRTPDGIFYYAMEYLPGFTLEALVDRHGPLPEGRVVHVLRQVCGSLAEAHRAGLVHRDIKPSNVMLCERGGVHDVVKVLDFGLARRYRGDRDEADLRDDGTVAGTPLYMAPEAFKAPEQASPQSDLYAVGALAYKLLTGQAPFHADNVFALYERHQHERAVAPSRARGRPICEKLEGLVLSCLEKDPERRPSDADAVVDWLDRCSAAGTWTEELAERWWREHAATLLPGSKDPDAPGAGATPADEHGETMTVVLARRRD